MNNEQKLTEAPRRAARIRAVVENCLRRRADGETVSDAALVEAHPDLMPELGDELSILGVIERARAGVGSGSSRGATLAGGAVEVPGYHVSSEIHRGGQGVVYDAVESSTGRRVAIKLMHRGSLARAQDRVRFEREVHILTGLDHPGIVKVFGSGSSGGRDYLVMDRIDGDPIDVFMKQHGDTDRAALALDLMIQVCEAVHAAHLRGVIHRDLKPANILVAQGSGFGVQGSGKKNQESGIAVSGLTPQPEPRTLNPDPSPTPQVKVLDFGLAKTAELQQETYTDTGQFIGSLPWASPEAAQGLHDQVDVRSDVYSLGVILYQLLAERFPYVVSGTPQAVVNQILQATPLPVSRFNARLTDDFDTVLTRCLAKDAGRRYQSAGDFGRELQRLRRREPIEARRDSLAFVMQRALRRHRIALGLAAGFVAVITVGLIASVTGWRAAAERLVRAETAERQQAHERNVAQTQAETATATNDLLRRILAAATPPGATTHEVTAREMLEAAAAQVDAGSTTNPEVEARVRMTLAQAFTSIGQPATARRHVERAIAFWRTRPDDGLALADGLGLLCHIAARQEDGVTAEQAGREALQICAALKLENHLVKAWALCYLGDGLKAAGKADEAIGYLRQAAAMFSALGTSEAAPLLNLADALGHQRATRDEAERIYDDLLAQQSPSHGARTRIYILSHLADLRLMRGDRAGAEPLYREALELGTPLIGADHPDLLVCLGNLATLLVDKHDYKQAEPLRRRLVELTRRSEGVETIALMNAVRALGDVLRGKGDLGEAEEQFGEALAIAGRIGQAAHIVACMARNDLAQCRIERGDFDGAQGLLREQLALTPANRMMQREQAVARTFLGECLAQAGDYAGAETLLVEGCTALLGDRAAGPVLCRQAVERLVRLYEQWNATAPSDELVAKAAQWRGKLPS